MRLAKARLHTASSRSLDGHGLGGGLPYLRKHGACREAQLRRGFRGTRYGAYVVPSFSGVKGRPKSVFIADASSVGCKFGANPVQTECSFGAEPVQLEGYRDASSGQI